MGRCLLHLTFCFSSALTPALDQGERVRLLSAVPETRRLLPGMLKPTDWAQLQGVLDQVTQTMTEEVKFQSPSKESEDGPLDHRVTPSDKLKWVIMRNWLRRHFFLGKKWF